MRKTLTPKAPPPEYSPSRRHFLKYGAMGAIGLAVARHGLAAFGRSAFKGYSAASPGPAPALGLPAGAAKSRVVLVRHPAVVDASGKVQASLLQKILDKAIIEFSGKSTVADAWRQYISPDDVVGLKINTLGLQEVKGTDYVQHFAAMNNALAAGLLLVLDRLGGFTGALPAAGGVLLPAAAAVLVDVALLVGVGLPRGVGVRLARFRVRDRGRVGGGLPGAGARRARL